MAKVSAGLILFRRRAARVEVLLVHPGGPLWAKKDAGAWSIPKGLVEPGEELSQAAQREFREETGFEAPRPTIPLGSVQQKGGKVVHAWAVEGDCDPEALVSNEFEMEWPPRSGRQQRFPEIDRARFFAVDMAREKILGAQIPFLERLRDALR